MENSLVELEDRNYNLSRRENYVFLAYYLLHTS